MTAAKVGDLIMSLVYTRIARDNEQDPVLARVVEVGEQVWLGDDAVRAELVDLPGSTGIWLEGEYTIVKEDEDD